MATPTVSVTRHHMCKRISAKGKFKFAAIMSSHSFLHILCWQPGSQNSTLSSEHVLQEFQIAFFDICDKKVV